MTILEHAQHARNNPCDVKCSPDGTLAWPELPRPRFELRGDAAAEPPAIDIGADILTIERRPAEPARITICRQSPQDAGYRALFWKTRQIVLRPGEHAKFTAINRTGTISFGLLFMLGAFPLYLTFERETEAVATDRLLPRRAT